MPKTISEVGDFQGIFFDAALMDPALKIDWIKQILGFDEHAAGLFVSGGSMANMAAPAATRRAKAPEDLMKQRRGINREADVRLSARNRW